MVRRRGRIRSGNRALPALLGLACAAALSPVQAGAASPAGRPAEPASLRLVTFDGPGTALRGSDVDAEVLQLQQDTALATVDAPDPAYRWTTALSGVAVELTQAQATELQGQPGVAAVEKNAVRPLAAARTRRPGAAPRGRGDGAGAVIGVVDTGIWPESPLFADSPAVGRRPARFTAEACAPAEDWAGDTCHAKLVAARWFARGFGEGRIAADEPLSARDVRGHGTQVASIAAGNSDVSVDVPGLPAEYSGVAPRAKVAAYKACWSAPDPDDDGCATADLVAAIDAATRDRVDVLNVSVPGGSGIDTVERALLGAAEAGIVVVGAAGNNGRDGYATHVSPWVTTVGALTTRAHPGTVAVGRRRSLAGTMTTRRPVRGPAVSGRSIPSTGRPASDAAVCLPGSLDAARAAGRIVVCERGSIGRVAKSDAVARADGAGMVLVNLHRGVLGHDLHAVPTVHLGRNDGRRLLRLLQRRPRAQVALAPGTTGRGRLRVAPASPAGDPAGSTLKPDLVAVGTGVLAGTSPTGGDRWTYLSGTSAATAWTSGAAATLVARHHWSGPVVRSVLASSGHRVPGSALRTGAGRPHLPAARGGRLAHDVGTGDYRSWLDGGRADVNTPSVLFAGSGEATRRVTNVGGRADTWRAEVSGFERYDVTVSPAALTLRPGEEASYRVTASGGSITGGLDGGAVTWVASDGSRARVPVAIGR